MAKRGHGRTIDQVTSPPPLNAASTRLPERTIRVTRARPDQWPEGIHVVLATQAATGVPDPLVRPPRILAGITAERHEEAESVWLAWDGATPVGHALIEPVARHRNVWPVVQAACGPVDVLELGGLAVLATHQRQGVATALRNARLEHVNTVRPDAAIVTVTWPGSISESWYSRHGTSLGTFTSSRNAELTVHGWLLRPPLTTAG